MNKQFLVGAAALLACATAANAAVLWSVPAGNLGSYSYDSGQNLNGQFGDGAASLDGFTFAPANFVASANGSASPVTVTDTASVVVHTIPPFWGVSVSLLGDYTILGTGSVNATGTITVTDLDSPNVYTLPLNMTSVPTSTTSTAKGGFSGSVDLLAVITNPSNARIDFAATLTATADGNSTALIQIKDAEIKLLLAPEPTSLAAIGLVGTLGRRTRRR